MDKETIHSVAANARLKLTEKEVDEILPRFEQVLESFSVLDRLDTSDVEPRFLPISVKNVARADKKKECLSQDTALSQTKHKEKGYFKGPRVV